MKTSMLIIVVLLVAAVTAGQAQVYTISDTYIGGDPTHSWAHTDVIGDYRYYDIDGMNVKNAGNNLSVDIFTSFVSQTSSSEIWSDKTHIGDLFIGTGGWKPSGTGTDKYLSDTSSTNKTNWDYAVLLTPHVPTINGDPIKKGTATLYATKDGSFIKSNLGGLDPNQWVYRADQYVQFNPATNAIPLIAGTWAISDSAFTKNGVTYGDLSINFDYSGIVALSDQWAFSWAMTCGNDVIQGQANVPTPVPEPSTMMLFGAGLIGVAVCRRRMKL